MNVKIYKCEICSAILCVPTKSWEQSIICPKCNKNMIKLDDEFDLSEIISEDIKEENNV